jgi:hypothetical protein
MLNENNHTYSFNLFESGTLPFSNISVNLFNDIENNNGRYLSFQDENQEYKMNFSDGSKDPFIDCFKTPLIHSDFAQIGSDDDMNLSIKLLLNPKPIPLSKEIPKEIVPLKLSNCSIESNNLNFESTKIFNITKETKETKESYSSFLDENNETSLLNRKRTRGNRRDRKDNSDNIYRKIKRSFFNYTLINELNTELKIARSVYSFEKFPQNFVSNVTKADNKIILDMTLLEIFKNEDLYKPKKTDKTDKKDKKDKKNKKDETEYLNNYKHNLTLVEKKEINQNERIKKILNKTFREIYTEHINSNEFIVNEIKRLKKKKMRDEYIKNYIKLSKNLINFFSQ